MTQEKQIYKCNICGNIIEVLHSGVGQLVCCGKPMELLTEKKEDVGKEKHLPVIEKLEKCVKIRVGSILHPTEQKHYIEWIEITTADGKSGKKFLKPEEEPTADFYTKVEVISARAYCNIHGLWEKNNF